MTLENASIRYQHQIQNINIWNARLKRLSISIYPE